ncbi:MAG: hypothetical protein IT457_08820 [Planctomycetes bacterium]|nr:hypothetical protein [Planctomycetota bacterium]
MNRDSDHDRDDDALDIVGYALGEGDAASRAAMQARVGRELELAVELAETRALFESMRALRTPTDPAFLATMAREVEWRRRLHALPQRSVAARVGFLLRAAAVAIVMLWLGNRYVRPDAVDPAPSTARIDWSATAPRAFVALGHATRPTAPALRPVLAPAIDAPDFVAAWERLAARPLPADFADWLAAENLLAQTRAALERRASPELRARWRYATGAADVEARVTRLVDELGARTVQLLAQAEPDVEDLACALRALLASGAIRGRRELLDACRDELARRVDRLDAGRAAVALAALADLAVLETDALGAFVAQRAERLAEAALERAPDGRRPPLLSWTEPAPRLAEAGRVLALAPAFGADAALSLRARMSIAAHLEERLARMQRFETPELHAAIAYGFGDLVELSAADAALAFWPARLLLPDYTALVHYTWSKYPLRAGWAELQLELRGLAALPTPTGLRDTAALLLALCSDAAARGQDRGFGSRVPGPRRNA